MTYTANVEVVVKWKTPGVIVAAVRDSSGIFDVTWSRSGGWSCSCLAQVRCVHVRAVDQIVAER